MKPAYVVIVDRSPLTCDPLAKNLKDSPIALFLNKEKADRVADAVKGKVKTIQEYLTYA